jgi:hypothetical protein
VPPNRKAGIINEQSYLDTDAYQMRIITQIIENDWAVVVPRQGMA